MACEALLANGSPHREGRDPVTLVVMGGDQSLELSVRVDLCGTPAPWVCEPGEICPMGSTQEAARPSAISTCPACEAFSVLRPRGCLLHASKALMRAWEDGVALRNSPRRIQGVSGPSPPAPPEAVPLMKRSLIAQTWRTGPHHTPGQAGGLCCLPASLM